MKKVLNIHVVTYPPILPTLPFWFTGPFELWRRARDRIVTIDEKLPPVYT